MKPDRPLDLLGERRPVLDLQRVAHAEVARAPRLRRVLFARRRRSSSWTMKRPRVGGRPLSFSRLAIACALAQRIARAHPRLDHAVQVDLHRVDRLDEAGAGAERGAQRCCCELWRWRRWRRRHGPASLEKGGASPVT